ncbi:2111_t:CDS:2, partial [Ambispora gerdemannii]
STLIFFNGRRRLLSLSSVALPTITEEFHYQVCPWQMAGRFQECSEVAKWTRR